MVEEERKCLKSVSAVLDESGDLIERVRNKDLLNRTFTIFGIELVVTNYGETLRVSVDDGEDLKVWVTSAMVIKKKLQLVETKNVFPVLATLVQRVSKTGRIYYDLV
jgi:hypothetical protein